MIPKKIHYCWFGRGPMPELSQRCVESWHRYMPDWEFKLWNEDNFDVDSLPYTSEAYRSHMFAFVSDYVRLLALYTEGGVYMDTDVEILRPLDDRLMSLTAFAGYEGTKHHPVGTGLLASLPGGEWVKEQLEHYSPELHFIRPDGTSDTTTNVHTIDVTMQSHGFIPNGKYQVYKDLHIFPTEWFCPLQTTGELLITDDTFCNHHFTGSWDGTPRHKPWWFKVIGQKNVTRLIKLKRRLIG